jgi:hypothetical protein
MIGIVLTAIGFVNDASQRLSRTEAKLGWGWYINVICAIRAHKRT